MSVTAHTRVYALLGDPVEHSLSPSFQNAAFRTAGLDAVYIALQCSTEAVTPVLRCLARAGGGGNVTIPYKTKAAAAVDIVTSAVVRTAACNTFWLENDRICGDNTDVAGFREAARALIGEVRGARALLLGAGGVARAAAYALVSDAAESVDIWNRSPEKARTMARQLDLDGFVLKARDRIADTYQQRYDLVINATSLGLRDDDLLPWKPERATASNAAVLDLVYRTGETALVHAARAAGMRAADGRLMLLHQGAAAFVRWTGKQAPLQAMREALDAAARPPG